MSKTSIPQDLKYTSQHEWVRIEGDVAVIGITDFAQQALGEITYVELPAAGATLARGKEFGVVESLKAASDVYAPVGGTVAEVNAVLEAEPKTVNADPYGAGWLCKVRGVRAGDLSNLLSPAQYAELVEKES